MLYLKLRQWAVVAAVVIMGVFLDPCPARTQDNQDAASGAQQVSGQSQKRPAEKGPVQFGHPLPLSDEGGAVPVDPDMDKQDPSMAGVKRSELAVAPIPIVNPTIGSGAGGAAVFLFRLEPDDAESPPATTMGGGFYTNSRSWGLGGVQKFYLFKDRLRIMGGGAYAQVNYDYYGIGNDSGSGGISIPLHQEGSGFLVEGLLRVWERIFIGPRYLLVKTKTELNIKWEDLPIPLPPPKALNANVAALGLHLQRDSRDSQVYPVGGSLLDFTFNSFGEKLGSDFDYYHVGIGFNKYFSLSPRQVVAMRFSGCHAGGDAPFFGLCALGKSEDIRGYEVGRYLDLNFLATQAEYRLQLPRRFGLVAFGGLGEVAESFGRFNARNLRPSGGGGIRFMLAPQSKINLRFDYAVGRNSSAWYVGLMEAF